MAISIIDVCSEEISNIYINAERTRKKEMPYQYGRTVLTVIVTFLAK